MVNSLLFAQIFIDGIIAINPALFDRISDVLNHKTILREPVICWRAFGGLTLAPT